MAEQDLQKLIEAVQTLKEVREAWLQTDCRAMENGALVDVFSEGLVEACADVRTAAAIPADAIPRDWWHLLRAADEFSDAFADWYRDRQDEVPGTPTDGTMRMMEKYRALMEPEMFEPVDRQPPPETIDSCMKAQVGHAQIAMMFGLVTIDEEGIWHPDVAALNEEIRNPGSRYDPAKFQSQAYREKMAKLQQYMGTRVLSSLQTDLTTNEIPTVPNLDPPEPLESQVCERNETLQHLMTMYPKKTREEILETAERMGVKLPDRPLMMGRPATRVGRGELRDEELQQAASEQDFVDQANRHHDKETILLRLLALRDDEGMKPSQISQLLEYEGITLSPVKIGMMLKEADKEAQQA